jgi:hypothetical protein
MNNATLLPSAALPTPAPAANRAFVPSLGTYEAVTHASGAQYALEDLAAALLAAGLALPPLLEQQLDAARTAFTAASDAWMLGFPC